MVGFLVLFEGVTGLLITGVGAGGGLARERGQDLVSYALRGSDCWEVESRGHGGRGGRRSGLSACSRTACCGSNVLVVLGTLLGYSWLAK